MSHLKQAAKEGFTLIEILVALAIVVIVGSMVGPAFFGYLERARVQTAKSTLRSYRTAINQFEVDHSLFPERLKDLVKKPANDEIAANWAPYIESKTIKKDPWGKSYQYRVTPDGQNPYELFSHGPRGGKKISVWDL